MGLFDQIVGAVANPALQGNADQLSGLFNTVQQLSGNQGVDASTTQAVLSAVSGQVKSALQNHQAAHGSQGVEDLINQVAGAASGAGALDVLFGGNQQQVTQTVAQQTGLNASTIQAMLPTLIPVVMGLLKTGAPAQSGASQGGNPVLNAFLDSDGDGDADMGDMMSLATRFLGR